MGTFFFFCCNYLACWIPLAGFHFGTGIVTVYFDTVRAVSVVQNKQLVMAWLVFVCNHTMAICLAGVPIFCYYLIHYGTQIFSQR
jgi:hypothetical protein